MKKPVEKFTLGRPITFPSNTELTNLISGMSTSYGDDYVSVTIGIGKDHIAELIIDKKALEALLDPDNEVRVPQIPVTGKSIRDSILDRGPNCR